MSIYLDNAATSFPKPENVYRAVERCLRDVGVGPGRGGHRRALDATRLVFDARERVAELLHVPDSSRIVFTHSATESLNLAITGSLSAGDHVVTTSMEHNSVVRPLHALSTRGVSVTKVTCETDGYLEPARVLEALRPETRMVVVSHCSNVTGTVQPIEEIGRCLMNRDILFVVDAAQSLGVLDIDPIATGIHLLAAPGHKGLLGPQGTGILYVAEGAEPSPLIVGGTGGFSDSAAQPGDMPVRYESGTLNTPGIAGLEAGVSFILDTGIDRIRAHELHLSDLLIRGIEAIPEARIHGRRGTEGRLGVVSFTVTGIDCAHIGFRLDRDFRIAVRVGLHCAPDAHRTIGTHPAGTVRVSPGWHTTEDDVEKFLAALAAIVQER